MKQLKEHKTPAIKLTKAERELILKQRQTAQQRKEEVKKEKENKKMRKVGYLKYDLYEDYFSGEVLTEVEKDEAIQEYLKAWKVVLPAGTKFICDEIINAPNYNYEYFTADHKYNYDTDDDQWIKDNLENITIEPKPQKRKRIRK